MIYITENEGHFEPCPCCGEVDIQWETFEFPIGERVRRHCRYCGMSTDWHNTDAGARKQWNTRYKGDGIAIMKYENIASDLSSLHWDNGCKHCPLLEECKKSDEECTRVWYDWLKRINED